MISAKLIRNIMHICTDYFYIKHMYIDLVFLIWNNYAVVLYGHHSLKTDGSLVIWLSGEGKVFQQFQDKTQFFRNPRNIQYSLYNFICPYSGNLTLWRWNALGTFTRFGYLAI